MMNTQVASTVPAPPRVLIVDDELPIRMLLARLVKTWGYSYRHCETAAEALAVMAADPADVLLCDVAMPEYDGLRLAEQVHMRWPRTAVIMCTGHEDAYTVQRSREAGAIGYVTKPLHPYLLREALDRAMHAA